YCAELEGNGGTCCEQNGFHSAASNRRVRPGGGCALARDRATHDSGFASAPLRTRRSTGESTGKTICRRPSRACDSWRCSIVAVRPATPRIRIMRLHSLRHSVQHSKDREEARAAAQNLRCTETGRQVHHLSGDE